MFFFLCDNLFLFIRVFFVQTSTNVFVGHTNAALMGFAPISKVLTTVIIIIIIKYNKTLFTCQIR